MNSGRFRLNKIKHFQQKDLFHSLAQRAKAFRRATSGGWNSEKIGFMPIPGRIAKPTCARQECNPLQILKKMGLGINPTAFNLQKQLVFLVLSWPNSGVGLRGLLSDRSLWSCRSS